MTNSLSRDKSQGGGPPSGWSTPSPSPPTSPTPTYLETRMLNTLEHEPDKKNPEEDLESLESLTKMKTKKLDQKIKMTKKKKMKTCDKVEEDDNAIEEGRQAEEESEKAYLLGFRPEADTGVLPRSLLSSTPSSSSAWDTVTPPAGSASTWGGGRGLSPHNISSEILTNHSLHADMPGLPRSVAEHFVRRNEKTTAGRYSTDRGVTE